jgi:uncharacterized protein (DUF1330 family)
MAMLAGAALGTAAVNGLYAQGKAPGAYVVADITEITDPEAYKEVIAKAPATIAAAGGHFIIRTEKIIALDGAPPKRFAVIAFDSVQQAQAWNASAAMKEIDALRIRTSKSRLFIVEGMSN